MWGVSMARKIKLEKILDRELDKEGIVLLAEEHGLDTKGKKEDLIKKLISVAPPEDILHFCFNVEGLKEILEAHGLPKSGNKDGLIERVLPLIEIPKVKAKPKKEEKTKKKVVKPANAGLIKDVEKIKKIIEDIEFQGTGKTKETGYEKQLVAVLQFGLGKERITYEKAVGRSRLDIVVDSGDNKKVGIELKLYTGTTSIDRLFGQIDRYLGSIYDRIIAVVITKKSIATARDEAKRIKKLKNVDVIVKAG